MIVPGAYVDLGQKPPPPHAGETADKNYISDHLSTLGELATSIAVSSVGIIIDRDGIAWAAPVWVFQTPVEGADRRKFRLGYRADDEAYKKLNVFIATQSPGQVTVLLEPPFDGDRVRISNH